MPRTDRRHDQLRPLSFTRGYTGAAPGSVLVKMGRTTVLCTCTVEPTVPAFLVGRGKGWLTAENGMLPGSTGSRKARDRGGKVDGRSVEIQRLIGRSLRAVTDLGRLGERTLWIDCDVLEADGGTRTASINGAFIAIVDALHHTRKAGGLPADAYRSPAGVPLSPPPKPAAVLKDSVAAISVGLLDGAELLDLEYGEDRVAEVDFNVVMTGSGRYVEVQGGGEEATFARDQLDRLLDVAGRGIATVTAGQRAALGERWPFTS
jgi:ribonuclease PH